MKTDSKDSFLLLFQMEKKKIYRGTATSFGFKKPAVTSSNIINNSKIPSFHPNNPAPFQEKLTDSAESLDTAHNLRNGEFQQICYLLF